MLAGGGYGAASAYRYEVLHRYEPQPVFGFTALFVVAGALLYSLVGAFFHRRPVTPNSLEPDPHPLEP